MGVDGDHAGAGRWLRRVEADIAAHRKSDPGVAGSAVGDCGRGGIAGAIVAAVPRHRCRRCGELAGESDAVAVGGQVVVAAAEGRLLT